MRWSIICLIWARELRDQLRDRRTVLMVTVLPVLLYPAIGFGLLQIAASFARSRAVVGVVGAEHLPPASFRSAGVSPLPALAAFALTPHGPCDPASAAGRVASAAAVVHWGGQGLAQTPPPLLLLDLDDSAAFAPFHLVPPADAESFSLRLLPGPASGGEEQSEWLKSVDRGPLNNRSVDALLVIPPGFRDRLEDGRRPVLYLLTRPTDERSRLTGQRVQQVLGEWRRLINKTRFLAAGLPANHDDPFAVSDDRPEDTPRRVAEQIATALVRVFPFLLVLWSLTGALYPAVDLCAGEKERGTMETLLISPVTREEIVYGKFLTIWVFSGGTALLNLLSMGLTTLPLAGALPGATLSPVALAWCVIVCLPLAAFFSALCLAVGAYARSSKEGQYYLMPLFLLTMPLIFLTLAPGVELNAFTSMVPVTGVALLLSRLLTAPTLGDVPWAYFVPVLGTMTVYGWLALRWAVWQFNREEVLFREAERLDVGLWLRALWQAKERLPTLGQALFCFALVLGLRWLSFGLGARLPLAARTAISTLAFVVAPPLFLAVMLTTHPLESLALRRPRGRHLALAVLLAALLAPVGGAMLDAATPWTEVTLQLRGHHPLPDALLAVQFGEPMPDGWHLVLALLPLACEELAFRGFILTGLRRRLGPWTAVALTAFLYALYPMNVFQFVPLFLLGLVLGVLATRSGSVLPGLVFHLLFAGLLLTLAWMQRSGGPTAEVAKLLVHPATAVVGTLIAAGVTAVTGYRHTAVVWAEK